MQKQKNRQRAEADKKAKGLFGDHGCPHGPVLCPDFVLWSMDLSVTTDWTVTDLPSENSCFVTPYIFQNSFSRNISDKLISDTTFGENKST